MAAVKLPADQRVVISCVDWDTYITIGDKLEERNLRFNYDGTNLEIMVTSFEHERAKKLLARLLEALTEEMEIAVISGGSLTCRRQDLERGFEPDECYWIAHQTQLRGRVDLDLARDPPPDLMLEVEISRSFVDRLAIAARLGLPEVWLWDGAALRVLLLGSNGQYAESERSRALPFLPLSGLIHFLQMRANVDETQLLRSFRAWVREQMAGGWGGATP